MSSTSFSLGDLIFLPCFWNDLSTGMLETRMSMRRCWSPQNEAAQWTITKHIQTLAACIAPAHPAFHKHLAQIPRSTSTSCATQAGDQAFQKLLLSYTGNQPSSSGMEISVPPRCVTANMNCTPIHVSSDAGAPTYMYEFQYRPSFVSDQRPQTVQGDHGDEIFSVFGTPFLKGMGSWPGVLWESGGLGFLVLVWGLQ